MRSLLVIGAAILFLSFFLTAYFLLNEDFRKGDVYADYSSFRSAPTGTRVLFQSLEAAEKEPTRNVQALGIRFVQAPPDQLLLLGYEGSSLTDTDDLLDKYVRDGGRLVIALRPDSAFENDSHTDEDNDDDANDKATKHDKSSPLDKNKGKPADPSPEENTDVPMPGATEQERYERQQAKKARERAQKYSDEPVPYHVYLPSLMARWGFGCMTHYQSKSERTDDDKVEFDAFPKNPPYGAENFLPWHSLNFFVRLDPAWTVLYSVEHRPVAIDRAYGKGHLTILSDSYLFTNKALKSEKRPGFLSWLIHDGAVFDETHLGTQQTQELSTFILHFRLEGYIVGMILVFLLYVWRSSSPLQPIQSDEVQSVTLGKSNTIAGRDARNGLVNLLRRNLAEANLLSTCLSEWKRSQGAAGLEAISRKVAELDQEANRKHTSQKDLIDSYKRLVQLVGTKKR